MALLLVRVVESKTGQSWMDVRIALEKMHAVELVTSYGHIKQRTETDKIQKTIFDRLKVKQPPIILGLFKHWDCILYLLCYGITGIIYNSTKLEVIHAKVNAKTLEISRFQEFSNNLIGNVSSEVIAYGLVA